MFKFDEPTHTYTLDGVRLPSVSDIIAPLKDFSGIPEKTLEYARDRGKAVHRATELYDKGVTFDLGADAEVIEPYLNGWLKFRAAHPSLAWDRIEVSDYHPTLGYAGTPDRSGWIGKTRVHVDIKATAKESPATGVQLAGYELLDRDVSVDYNRVKVVRWGVRLLKDGTYRKTEYKDERVTFRSLLNIYRWRQVNE